MQGEKFADMLTGGHSNSLGRTLAVVDCVLTHPARLDELYNCYFSDDAVVRLRVSNAIKRITRQHPDWLVPHLDKLITTVANIEQASTQWTLANLFNMLDSYMTAEQRQSAKGVLQRNLQTYDDWIVLKNTMQTRNYWAHTNQELRRWLTLHLETMSLDTRKAATSAKKPLALWHEHA